MGVLLTSAKFWQSFQVWWLKQQQSWPDWIRRRQPQPTRPKSWVQLPKEFRADLLQHFRRLPVPESYLNLLQQDFLRAFDVWSEQESSPRSEVWSVQERDNVWVVVGSSATDLSALMDAFLDRIGCSISRDSDSDGDGDGDGNGNTDTDSGSGPKLAHQSLPVELIRWPVRPSTREIRKQLQQQLEVGFETANGGMDSAEAGWGDRRIYVIPSLEQCFLRSVDGLAGLDYLREQQFNDRSQFWILGVGRVAWTYLQTIGAVEVSGDRVTPLPGLSGEQLSQWLDNTVADLDLDFGSPLQPANPIAQDLDQRTRYFETLAEAAEGIDAVATQLFLNTLNPKAASDLDPNAKIQRRKMSKEIGSAERQALEVSLPNRPSLPELKGDLAPYMLYSLLLHQQLTPPQLAQSLGLSPERTQGCMQQLAQAGLLEQRGSLLRLSPVYYLAVQSRLKGDNFLI